MLLPNLGIFVRNFIGKKMRSVRTSGITSERRLVSWIFFLFNIFTRFLQKKKTPTTTTTTTKTTKTTYEEKKYIYLISEIFLRKKKEKTLYFIITCFLRNKNLSGKSLIDFFFFLSLNAIQLKRNYIYLKMKKL